MVVCVSTSIQGGPLTDAQRVYEHPVEIEEVSYEQRRDHFTNRKR